MNLKPLHLFMAATLLGGVLTSSLTVPPAQAGPVPSPQAKATNPAAKVKKTIAAVEAQHRPLNQATLKGLSWLAAHQNPDGGWGQGEESSAMGGGRAGLRTTARISDDLSRSEKSPPPQVANLPQPTAYQSNVADTSTACLALLRSGQTLTEGEYKDSLRKGVDYVCQQIEKSDADSIWVSDIKGTRVQAKLGPTIDTFMANLMLAELKGGALDGATEKRVTAAIEKVLHKIEKNQKSDGTWSNEGWAPVLAQSVAVKGLNRAAQNDLKVSETTLARADEQAQRQMKSPGGGPGDAGVALYRTSAAVAGVSDSLQTLQKDEKRLRDQAVNGRDQNERNQAGEKLKRLEAGRAASQEMQREIASKLDDKGFIAGFGSNGGEEFLSYMNISEGLLAKGGAEWEKWDRSMTENLSHIQNPDGSWTGHHCITGKTFCTASAILVLTAERAPQPLRIKKSS